MEEANLIASLKRFGKLLPSLVKDVSEAESRWKPASKDWSILEVVRHLGDEEELDFGRRMRLLLSDPNTPWPPIDPEGWAVERRYNEGSLPEAVERFSQLRSASVAWLEGLGEVDWSITYHHPEFGPFHAGDLLGSWACHDALHLRQIAKRLYQLAQRDAEGYSTRYAGEW